jgi:RNA polymerase sigma-70 factor, ECF subfamily
MGNRVDPATQEGLVTRAGELVAAEGDEEGEPAVVRPPFRQIFDEHVAAVGRTLRYLGIPEADLWDATQDVFVVVDRRHGEFEGRSRLSTWIRQICVRVAFAHRRRHVRRREELVAQPPEAIVEADQHTDIEQREQRALLTRLLDTLDDNHRAIIVLHEIERLPMREVAEAVGCPLQTAYSRRNVALEQLRAALQRLKATS